MTYRIAALAALLSLTGTAMAPDRYVYEELEILYHARGDEDRAAHYAALKRAAQG